MLLNIRQLMDDAKCYEVVRELRWPDGVKCPACDSGQINKRGFHDHQVTKANKEQFFGIIRLA